MSQERFTYIDALRGIAIAGVILTHAASITNLGGSPRYLMSLGGMGVQLFFVISAFTIFYSLTKTDGLKNQFRDFYIRRLFRIIPIYWLGIILYTAVYGLDSRGWRAGPELWHFPFHIFFINIFHPLTSSSVVPGGWSISCEVMFYLMVPLLYKYFYTNKRIAVFMIFSVIILPIANSMLRDYSIHTFFESYEELVIYNFYYRWIPSQLACFGFGMILFKIYKDGSYKNYISNKRVNLALLALILILIVVVKKSKLEIPTVPHMYALLFMVLALLLSVYPWKLFVNYFTVFLGKISYSGYLLHFLVIKQTTIAIEKYSPSIMESTPKYFIVVAIIGFLVTIPLAYLSYKFIELNAVKAGRKLIEKLNSKQLQVA
jgi:peptidoglycan/LPS O-acetylase OafA/YrhL